MRVSNYFEFYCRAFEINHAYSIKTNKIKNFTFLSKKSDICNYLKSNKDKIINSINYAFFDESSDNILEIYSRGNCKYVFINTKHLQSYPKQFENSVEYENYLTIYGTFGVLLGLDFKIESFNDTRLLIDIREILSDLTNQIFYDNKFRLNLASFAKGNKSVFHIYRFGYNFFYELFRASYHSRILEEDIILFLFNSGLSDVEIRDLFEMYYEQILIEKY